MSSATARGRVVRRRSAVVLRRRSTVVLRRRSGIPICAAVCCRSRTLPRRRSIVRLASALEVLITALRALSGTLRTALGTLGTVGTEGASGARLRGRIAAAEVAPRRTSTGGTEAMEVPRPGGTDPRSLRGSSVAVVQRRVGIGCAHAVSRVVRPSCAPGEASAEASGVDAAKAVTIMMVEAGVNEEAAAKPVRAPTPAAPTAPAAEEQADADRRIPTVAVVGVIQRGISSPYGSAPNISGVVLRNVGSPAGQPAESQSPVARSGSAWSPSLPGWTAACRSTAHGRAYAAPTP